MVELWYSTVQGGRTGCPSLSTPEHQNLCLGVMKEAWKIWARPVEYIYCYTRPFYSLQSTLHHIIIIRHLKHLLLQYFWLALCSVINYSIDFGFYKSVIYYDDGDDGTIFL